MRSLVKFVQHLRSSKQAEQYTIRSLRCSTTKTMGFSICIWKVTILTNHKIKGLLFEVKKFRCSNFVNLRSIRCEMDTSNEPLFTPSIKYHLIDVVPATRSSTHLRVSSKTRLGPLNQALLLSLPQISNVFVSRSPPTRPKGEAQRTSKEI